MSMVSSFTGSHGNLVLNPVSPAVPTPGPQFPHLSKVNNNSSQDHCGDQGSGMNSAGE